MHYRGSGLHMVIAPRAREASVQISCYWRRAGCQASSEPCPVPIWDDRRASGQQLPDRSKDTRPGSSFLRLPLPGLRPGWPIRQNTKRTKTLIVQCGFHPPTDEQEEKAGNNPAGSCRGAVLPGRRQHRARSVKDALRRLRRCARRPARSKSGRREVVFDRTKGGEVDAHALAASPTL
jgi:hypothetical protein